MMNDPHLAKDLARAGQERMRTRFSFDRLMTELQQLYSCTLESRSARSEDTTASRNTGQPKTPQGKAIHAL
jgi:hypothetical protein